MRSLETAADQAINWHTLPLTDDEAEVARVMQICNACRYCEGYCAVFPAMTRRLTFDNKADLNYLANLCHNCTACLHACQYAPPHEFAVNVPKAMAKVRKDTYSEYAWPAGLGKLYKRNGLILSLVVALALVLFLVMAAGTAGGLNHGPLNGDFYAIFPHNTLVLMFGTVFLYAVFALFWSTRRFWKDISPGRPTEPAIMETTRDALTMKYLDGGHGMGCNDEDDKFTLRRRIFHHFTFYGFALCFAATSVGTIYHYVFGWYAPYDYFSLPVILGTLGGIGLVIGPVGLFWLNRVRASQASDPEQAGMDLGFIALLFLISVTGLILLVLRDTGQMGLWLAIHLGFVMGFFLMMPYSKFAHGFYRVAALLKYAIERRQPNKAGLPD